MHLTASYRAIASLLQAYADWATFHGDKHTGTLWRAQRRMALAASSSSVSLDRSGGALAGGHSRSDVVNETGTALKVRVYNGEPGGGVEEADLLPGTATEMLTEKRKLSARRELERATRVLLAVELQGISVPVEAFQALDRAPRDGSDDASCLVEGSHVVSCSFEVVWSGASDEDTVIASSSARSLVASTLSGSVVAAARERILVPVALLPAPPGPISPEKVRPCAVRVKATLESPAGGCVHLGGARVNVDRQAVVEDVNAGLGWAPGGGRRGGGPQEVGVVLSGGMGQSQASVRVSISTAGIIEAPESAVRRGETGSVGARAVSIQGVEDILGPIWGLMPSVGSGQAPENGRGPRGEGEGEAARVFEVGGQVLVVEREVSGGRMVDRIRSPCRVVNSMPFDIEVMVVAHGTHDGAAGGERRGGEPEKGQKKTGKDKGTSDGPFVLDVDKDGPGRENVVVYENQRFQPLR